MSETQSTKHPKAAPSPPPVEEVEAVEMAYAVINNREALCQGQMPHLGVDAQKRTQLGEVVTLFPGLNLLAVEKLEILRKNPGFNARFKTKIPPSRAPEQNAERVGQKELVILEEVGDGGKVPLKGTLQRLPPKQCEMLIEECLDAELLRRWLKEEGRSDVRILIHNQLDAIGSGEAGGGPAVAGR